MISALELVDFAALSPLLFLLGGSLLLLVVESISGKTANQYAFLLTIMTLVLGLAAAILAPASTNPLLTRWINFDPFDRFFVIFFMLIGLGAALLSASFFQCFKASQGEYFFLLISSLFGLILIGGAADLLTLFLGIETLSISLYVLCGYMKRWELSHEAAIKYFLTGAFATALLIYGVALLYGALGTTHLDALLPGYRSLDSSSQKSLFFGGIALITVSLAFKAAVVPFHTWAPDVYAGAPTPVTAFMAIGTKVGIFAAFIRLFFEALPRFELFWNEGLAVLAYLTMIYANFVALRQLQLRRFFAYSGIAHAGYLLIPLVVESQEALPALIFYLVVYAAATFGCFAVLAFLDHRAEGVTMQDLRELFYRSPFLASVFILCLLTLAGVPPTAGFFAKFYVFKVAFQDGYYGLVIVGLLTTILSIFYYLRLASLMFTKAHEEKPALPHSWPAAIVGAFSLAFIFVLSFYPTPFLALLDQVHR